MTRRAFIERRRPVPPAAPAAAPLGRASDRARNGVILLALVGGLLILGLLGRGGPLPMDVDLASVVGGWYPRPAADVLDTFASVPVIVAIGMAGIFVSLIRRDPGSAVAFALGLTSEVPTTLLKYAFDRPRPPGSTEIEAIGSIAGYPSGHTTRALVMTGLLVAAFAWRSRPAIRGIAVVLASALVVLVGLARIASGQHWPTDVVGGLLLGAAWLIVCQNTSDHVAHVRSRAPSTST